jgi:transcriptional regulator GlxA family with amidase domain
MLQGDNKIGAVAAACGWQSENQLRNIIRKHTGTLPSALRERV